MVRTREIQLGTKISESPNRSNPLIIHEHDDVCDSVTGRVMTGSWVWGSAHVLSHYIFTRVESTSEFSFILQGKTVLELGAGTGLSGLTASRLGADRVILTDLAPLLPGLRNNVEVNGLDDRVEVCELVWGSDELPSQISELRLNGVDLVLMSDVFYDPSLMRFLGKTLKMVCGSETNIWSASEVRQSTGECLNELASHGFKVTEFPSEMSQHSSSELEISTDEYAVYLITPPGKWSTH